MSTTQPPTPPTDGENQKEESPKVVTIFSKRFEDRPAPVKIPPTWCITYAVDKDTTKERYVQGYVQRFMPFVMISINEKAENENDYVYTLPCERLVDIVRAEPPPQTEA